MKQTKMKLVKIINKLTEEASEREGGGQSHRRQISSFLSSPSTIHYMLDFKDILFNMLK